jgi:RNA polymerase sigma-70 factor (ECF subfamily)
LVSRQALSDVDERERAIERVYRERFVAFANALAAVTGSYDTGRDAVQEGFARALRERSGFRGEAPLEAWIFRIALRAALELRRNGREVPLDEVLDPELLEPERDPELATALRSLAPRRRLVVFLRYFADLSYEEIASTCEISEGTVAASLAQARAALLEALQPDEVKT